MRNIAKPLRWFVEENHQVQDSAAYLREKMMNYPKTIVNPSATWMTVGRCSDHGHGSLPFQRGRLQGRPPDRTGPLPRHEGDYSGVHLQGVLARGGSNRWVWGGSIRLGGDKDGAGGGRTIKCPSSVRVHVGGGRTTSLAE